MARLVFMGSPDFALPSLAALLGAGHEIALVLSRPDQPAGRGRGLTPTAVAAFARERGLPLETPASLREPALRERLAALAPELFVVVAYRILPGSLLAVPRRGAINLHGSLLPDYRGAAPVERALMDGAARTGLTTFLLERGVDTGMILDQLAVEVGENETAGELRARLRELGAPLLADSVQAVLEGRHRPRPQQAGEFRTAPKLGPADRLLDFGGPARALHNRVRALSPEPGALAAFRGQPLQLLATRVERETGSGRPGLLRREGGRLFASCGGGEVEILELAPAGRRRMAAAAWLAGARLGENEQLERAGDPPVVTAQSGDTR
jgi:methionyl-tRNA formyltransferase